MSKLKGQPRQVIRDMLTVQIQSLLGHDDPYSQGKIDMAKTLWVMLNCGEMAPLVTGYLKPPITDERSELLAARRAQIAQAEVSKTAAELAKTGVVKAKTPAEIEANKAALAKARAAYLASKQAA